MNENFEAFLKKRLEEGVAADPPRLAEIERLATEASFARAAARRRSRLRAWGGSSLVAAALAVVCSFAALHVNSKPTPEETVAQIIYLLRVSDGNESDLDEDASFEDILLAWQDAPYEAALYDLASGDLTSQTSEN